MLHQVIPLLHGALSHESSQQQQAETQLGVLSSAPGFCSCLADVVAANGADRSARWLAVVTLKNHVAKNWRQRPAAQCISPEEKNHLRGKLLSLLPEQDDQIALQLAIVLAKVARVDYPREWASLFADLLSTLTPDTATQLPGARVYLALHHTLKELSTKRLAADQQNFAEVTKVIFDHVWGRWVADTQSILAAAAAGVGPEAVQQLQLRFECWHLLLKVLKRLLLFGFPSDAKALQSVPAVASCMPPMQQAIEGLMAATQQLQAAPAAAPLVPQAARAVVQLVKCQREVLECHPWSYYSAGALLPMMEFCCSQVVGGASGGQAGQGPWPASAAIPLLTQCLVFLCAVVQCPSFKHKAGPQGPAGQDLKGQVQAALAAFWTASRLTSLTNTLLTSYFPLTPEELTEWEGDPESWHHGEDSSAWQHSLHLAAHTLFLALLKAHQDTLAPAVVQLLHQTLAACPPAAPPASLPGPPVGPLRVPIQVLVKDALYSAVAIGVYELLDALDYPALLHQVLLPELADATPQNKYTRRRAVRIIGAWVMALRPDDRPPLYSGLASLLGGGDDLGVRLAAVGALAGLVDDMGFDEAQFQPVVSACLRSLAGLLLQSGELDTLTLAFTLVNLIIERVGQGVQPHVGDLLQLLPRVWQGAEGHVLIRIQVLVSLQRLVQVLGPEAQVALPVVLPLLQQCLDPANKDGLSLVEDALALWGTALRHAATPQPPLLDLYPSLAHVMAGSTEFIAPSVVITCSCVLTGGEGFLVAHGRVVAAALEGYLCNVNDKGHLLLFHLTDLLLLVAPAPAVQLLGTFLQRLLGMLLGGQESTIVVAAALGVVARMVLQQPGSFPQLLQSLAASHSSQPDAVLDALLTVWTDQFDSIATPRARKASALGLCALLRLPLPAPLQSLEAVVTCVTAVCFEQEDGGAVGEGSGGGGFGYEYDVVSRVGLSELGGWAAEEAEGESQRLEEVAKRDPVNGLRVGQFLRESLDAAAGLHGGAVVQEALRALHPSLGRQVQQVTGLQ